jgi:hypothetical protein
VYKRQVVEQEGMKKGKKILAIEGATVINKRRFLMHLNKEEVKPYQLMKKVDDQEPEIIFNIPLGNEDNDEEEFNTAVKVEVKDRKEKVTFENGIPAVSFQLNMDATIMETGSEENLRTDETNEKILEEVTEQITNQIESLVFKTQKEKKYWREHEKEWDNIYPEIPIQLSIDWNLVRNGMITQIKQGEQK